MKRCSIALLGVLILSIGASGCMYSYVDSRTSYFPSKESKAHTMYPKTTGSACAFNLFYVFSLGDDRVEAALFDAVPPGSKVDNLFGYTVEESMGWFIIGTYTCTHVSGYPVQYDGSDTSKGPFSFEMNPHKKVYVAPTPSYMQTSPQPQPQPTPQPTPQPSPTPYYGQPTPQPTPQPAPQPQTIEIDCDELCENYVKPLAKQSASIRKVIFDKCIEKCEAGNPKFIPCAQKAKTMDDIGTCNQF